nr:uncharacterized protein LOC128704443 [Cherax quadricarinatus]
MKVLASKSDPPLGAILTCSKVGISVEWSEETGLALSDTFSVTSSHGISRHLARVNPSLDLYPSHILHRTERVCRKLKFTKIKTIFPTRNTPTVRLTTCSTYVHSTYDRASGSPVDACYCTIFDNTRGSNEPCRQHQFELPCPISSIILY